MIWRNLFLFIIKKLKIKKERTHSSVVPHANHKTDLTCLIFSPARGRGSSAPTSNVQQSNSRHGEARHSACIHCHQTGHSSSDCPSQVSGSRSARRRGMNPQSGMPAELPFYFLFISNESIYSKANCIIACWN